MLEVKAESLELRTVNIAEKGAKEAEYMEMIVHKVDP